MVWELSELTKLDTAVPYAQKEKVDYGQCVREIVARVESSIDREHAEIRVAAPAKAVFARIVPGRIEQVIGNLIDNAVRYTPASGLIEVQVEPGPERTVITSIPRHGMRHRAVEPGQGLRPLLPPLSPRIAKDYGSVWDSRSPRAS